MEPRTAVHLAVRAFTEFFFQKNCLKDLIRNLICKRRIRWMHKCFSNKPSALGSNLKCIFWTFEKNILASLLLPRDKVQMIVGKKYCTGNKNLVVIFFCFVIIVQKPTQQNPSLLIANSSLHLLVEPCLRISFISNFVRFLSNELPIRLKHGGSAHRSFSKFGLSA